MSGFAGVVRIDGAPPSAHTQALARAVAHRGRDGHDAWSDETTVLAHALLRTTAEDEQQPLVDGDLTIVADIRLDNRSVLSGLLGVANDASDAAFVVAAYRRWGVECARQLEGDFAFAIWDRRTRTLFCARDPFGVKPFVYALVSQKLFAFGSEVRAVLAADGVPQDFDERRIADFLSVYFDDHERTFHRAVKRLPGGHTLVFDGETPSISRYWFPRQVRPLRLRGGDAAYAEGFREHFRHAVQVRMRSSAVTDVGALLSGGLDSTSIACVARDSLAAAGGPPLPVFTWIFSDAMEADEREFQVPVIAAGGMRRITLDSADSGVSLWNDIDALLPDGPPYAPNVYLNLEIAKRAGSLGLRTLLDGLGGDSVVSRGAGRLVELFVRGRGFALARELRELARLRERGESPARLFLSHVVSPLMPARVLAAANMLRGRRSSQTLLRLLSPRVASLSGRGRTREPAFFSAAEEHVRQFESPMIAEGLELFDRLYAHAGVEARYPFFDRALAEYCLSLPADQKLAGGYSRIVARRAMQGIIPEEVQWRAGKGAPGLHVIPALRASRSQLDELFRASLLEPYVDVGTLRSVYAQFISGGPVDLKILMGLWSAATLALWLRASTTKTLY